MGNVMIRKLRRFYKESFNDINDEISTGEELDTNNVNIVQKKLIKISENIKQQIEKRLKRAGATLDIEETSAFDDYGDDDIDECYCQLSLGGVCVWIYAFFNEANGLYDEDEFSLNISSPAKELGERRFNSKTKITEIVDFIFKRVSLMDLTDML